MTGRTPLTFQTHSLGDPGFYSRYPWVFRTIGSGRTMRTGRLIRRAAWPKRRFRNVKIATQSVIPPRSWKYWLAVGLITVVMGFLTYVLIKVS